MSRTKKDLKAIVEKGIMDVLESKEEPSDGRIKALALGIKMCALNAKMEESEYGDYFKDDESVEWSPHGKHTQSGSTAGDEKGTKPANRKRANGADDPAAAILPE